MEILNEIPNYEDVDGFLAFVGMYEDRARLEAYRRFLARFPLQGAVCVEAGAGFGIFTEWMLYLGARKVYAVEENPLMADLLRERFRREPRVTVVEALIEDFAPPEPVDLLVHDFFGPLLYDESLYALERLPFRPAQVFPNQGELLWGLVEARRQVDEVVSMPVLRRLEGVLISDLFPEPVQEPDQVLFRWRYSEGLSGPSRVSLKGLPGDLLVFGVRLLHDGEEVCRAGRCVNWPWVWTPRAGDLFQLTFRPTRAHTEVHFEWVG